MGREEGRKGGYKHRFPYGDESSYSTDETKQNTDIRMKKMGVD
jgi:hypothetical protein